MLPGNDVLDMERATERRLRQMTVLTPIAGASPDIPGTFTHALD
jgi:hypothetical protein